MHAYTHEHSHLMYDERYDDKCNSVIVLKTSIVFQRHALHTHIRFTHSPIFPSLYFIFHYLTITAYYTKT